MLIVATLNINGMNNTTKQIQILNHVNQHNIDILMLQEHNLKSLDNIDESFSKEFNIVINYTINIKGGTAILFKKSLPIKITNIEKSVDSRILSVRILYYKYELQLVNVYAPSGSNCLREREELFQTDLLYYLRRNLNKTIIAGDWNCVIGKRDSTSSNCHVSKALTSTIRTLKLKDAWFIPNKQRAIEYTYIRQSCKSRLDRIYICELATSVSNTQVVHTSISDHSCVMTTLNIEGTPVPGKYYWKLNTSLLDDTLVKQRFSELWNSLKRQIHNYQSINDWWENFVKLKIKTFFINEGKVANKKIYGMIEYLDCCLANLYVSDGNNYNEIKLLKGRINTFKSKILEGVKIRSRITEQIEGEQMSAYLIQKQSSIKSKKLISSLKAENNVMNTVENGDTINNPEMIKAYVGKFYEQLYKIENCNLEKQNNFLDNIPKSITDGDNHNLVNVISEVELYETLSKMSVNKSPGIDGIPVEFYLELWDIIKTEMCEIFNAIISNLKLDGNQNLGIITLISKDSNDDENLSDWRPISLLCVDAKILAKLYAERLKKVIDKVVHPNQYCAPYKTIVDSNNNIRDLIFYCNKENVPGCILNLDWSKAFDKVNIDFLCKIMSKMGFSNTFIDVIMIFYVDRTSRCLVNGNLTDTFKVERGIRQGCPLSMLLFIISQEPLYTSIEICHKIIPFKTPNSSLKLQGYADDTNIILSDDQSIYEAFKMVIDFTEAAGASLNIRKTKIFGMGTWSGKTTWPINSIKVETEYLYTLGIKHTNSYQDSINTCWSEVHDKIKNQAKTMISRTLTILQKTIIVNSILTSQIWYRAQTYPLSLDWSRKINKIICNYIWGSKINPIKHATLTLDKKEGGLSLVCIYTKAKSIFACRIIKQFLIDESQNSLLFFYIAMRLNPMFNIRSLPTYICSVTTPYFEEGIGTIRNIIHINGFPNVISKAAYEYLLDRSPPKVQERYQFSNWKNIWNNINFKYIPIRSREIVFKYLHGILPNKYRLKHIRRSDSDLCDWCNVPETNKHMVYQCQEILEVKNFLVRLLEYFGFLNVNMIQLFLLDIPNIGKQRKNTVIFVTTLYISSIWYGRSNKTRILSSFKSNLLREKTILEAMLKDKFTDIFTESFHVMNSNIVESI